MNDRPPIRWLVTGDRKWNLSGVMSKALGDRLQPGDTLIHGDAQGADKMAGRLAAGMEGIVIEAYPANWANYGRAAGPIRNKEMLDVGKPDRALAFHADLENSKGTKDMVKRLRKAGVPVEIFTGKERVDGEMFHLQ
jgi:hypothetical protein